MGKDGFGYVDVPDTWIEFRDFRQIEDYQITDGFESIITMSKGHRLKRHETIKTICNLVLRSHKAEGGKDSVLEKTKLREFDAYSVTTDHPFYKGGTKQVSYVFLDPKNKFRMITVEALYANFEATLQYLTYSFRLEK